jgi:hypothetical protein
VSNCSVINPTTTPDGCGSTCFRLQDECFAKCPKYYMPGEGDDVEYCVAVPCDDSALTPGGGCELPACRFDAAEKKCVLDTCQFYSLKKCNTRFSEGFILLFCKCCYHCFFLLYFVLFRKKKKKKKTI